MPGRELLYTGPMPTRESNTLVALVTGASRGIGAATAQAVAVAGVDLVLASTTKTGTDRIAKTCRALGRQVLQCTHDAAQAGSAERLVKAAMKRFGHIDILINNAGIVIRKPVDRLTDDDFQRVIDVNLNGPFFLCRRVLPQMLKRRWGRVVNVSSISATLGSHSNSAYNASKWGLDGLTRSLAEELRGTGVTINSILPGSVDTDMLKGSGFEPMMTADDVAGVIRYLVLGAPEAMQGSRVEVFG